MTAVLDDNVRTIAVQGSFDDCQSILKAVFSDLHFKSHFHLGAVNSVNWARVLAQLVYYFFRPMFSLAAHPGSRYPYRQGISGTSLPGLSHGKWGCRSVI